MPAPSVGQLLNSAQDSAAASERCASSLWKLALADPDGTYEELHKCVDHQVTVSQVCTPKHGTPALALSP